MSLHWLPLTEYSSKYKVSISTLRRRIKAEEIKYSFEDGKYLIWDGPLNTTKAPKDLIQERHRPSQGTHVSPSLENQILKEPKEDEPILTAANRLLTELKKAYTQILQEKEEQIIHLKDEVADLKTLVRVLESENIRLGGHVETN